MSYRDIVTATEFQDMHPGLGLDYSNAQVNTLVSRCISMASRKIESYLGRPVIVDKVIEDVYMEQLEDRYLMGVVFNIGTSNIVRVYRPRVTPVVQVNEPASGVVISDDLETIQIYPLTAPFQIEYYGGWKRADQTLATLQTYYADLATEPPNVPDDIVHACLHIAGVYVRAYWTGSIGSVRRVRLGELETQVERFAFDEIDMMLDSLSMYRELRVP